MASLISYEVRRENLHAAGQQLTNRHNLHRAQGQELLRDQLNWQRKALHLLYEVSPMQARGFFLTDALVKLIDSVLRAIRGILYGFLSLLCCGLNSEFNYRCKNSFSSAKNTAIEIPYALFASIHPKKGIDKYIDLRIQHG